MTFSARTPTITTNTAATAPILYYLTFHLALCPTQEEGEEWNLILLPINFKFIPIITAFFTFSHLRRVVFGLLPTGTNPSKSALCQKTRNCCYRCWWCHCTRDGMVEEWVSLLNCLFIFNDWTNKREISLTESRHANLDWNGNKILSAWSAFR